MKTLFRLIMLLVVLAFCVPAKADILIYSKIVKCWIAEDTGDEDWYINTERNKGFLILDVNIVEGQIAGIDNAIQIDYGKFRNEKWTDVVSHNINIEKIGHDGNVQYILTESEFDNGDFWVMMVTGEARNYNIGLQNQPQIPRQLKGNILWHDFSDINKICDIRMRVQQNFTKEANELEMDFNEAYNMVQDWLRKRGWYFDQEPGGDDEPVTNAIIESFEKGYLVEPWYTYGDESWYITSNNRHTGNYSVRAGAIGDNQISSLQLVANCNQGEISFYLKISSEEKYDYLKFYINGIEKGRWSGQQDWERVSFPINEGGLRNFRWEYSKDRSNSSGNDTAYIDDIEYPGY